MYEESLARVGVGEGEDEIADLWLLLVTKLLM